MLSDPNFSAWLQARNINITNPVSESPFDYATYNGIVNGTLIAPVLLEFLDKSPSIGASHKLKARLKSLQTDTTFATKTRNWGVLQRTMLQLGYSLGEETKAMVVAGVTDEIVKVLQAIRELEVKVSARGTLKSERSVKPKIRVGPDGALFLESVAATQPLAQTTYCLEFLLVSMSKAFYIKPKQAAVLMTRSGHFLSKILKNGLRKQFVPVIEWISAMIEQSQHLCTLMAAEQSNGAIPFVFQTLLPGFQSKNEDVVRRVSELFTKIAKNEGVKADSWEWFKGDPTCLRTAVAAFGRRPSLLGCVVDMMFGFGDLNLECMLKQMLPVCFAKPIDYLIFVIEMYESLMLLPNIHTELLKSTLIEYWISTALAVLQEPCEPVLSITELMCFLWATFPHRLNDTTSESVLSCLKKLLRDKRVCMRLRSVSMLFYLYDTFALRRSPYALSIYKTLVDYYIEAYNSCIIRKLMVFNFAVLFRRSEGPPIGMLAEPLFKLLKLRSCRKAEIVDIDLIIAMAQHPQLDWKGAAVLLNMLGLLFMNAPIFAQTCSSTMVAVSKGFLYNESILDYLVRFTKSGIQLISSAYKKKQPATTRGLQSSRSATLDRTLRLTPSNSVTEFGLTSPSLKKGSIVINFAKDLFELKHSVLGEKLQTALLDFNEQYNAKTGEDYQPVKHLLSRYGGSKTLAALYSSLLGSSMALVPLFDSKAHNAKISEAIQGVRLKRIAAIDYETRRVSNEEARKRRQLKLLQQKFELQKIKLGIPQEDDDKPLIFPFDSQQREDIDLELYEVAAADQTALQQVLRRHRRAIKAIFNAYAFTRSQEFASEKLLTEGQHWHLLKENGLTLQMLSNDEFRRLLKKFCLRTDRTNSTLDLKSFGEFIVQLGCFVFYKDRYGCADLPPAIVVDMLFYVFKSAFEARGESTAVFDDAESQLAKTLNEKLAENPEFELPQNYQRCEEVKLDVTYSLPPLELDESQVAALEVIDEVFMRALGIHWLRPVVVEYPSYYAKKNPQKACISQGNLDIPLEFSQPLKDAIISGLDHFDLCEMVEVGYLLHSACEGIVKDVKTNVRNKATEARLEVVKMNLKDREELRERIKDRGKELKARIEELKKAKAETEQSEMPLRLAQK